MTMQEPAINNQLFNQCRTMQYPLRQTDRKRLILECAKDSMTEERERTSPVPYTLGGPKCA